MEKFTFMIEDRQRNYLEERSKKRDRSIGFIIREIIDGAVNNSDFDEGDQDEDSN